MSESYKHVVKGGLKLKGGAGLPTAGGVKKKKKKKKDKELGEVRRPRRPPPPRAPIPNPQSARAGGEETALRVPEVEDRRTAAERRYDERMEKQQEKIVEKMASKSHRDKVADFNAYLSKLSEHHDIPKVGPG
jgi:protein FAM32A